MRTRAILSCIVLAGTVAGIPAGSAPPAAAQAAAPFTVVSGNFSGDARDETLWYQPGGGTGNVTIVSSSNGGVPGGELVETEYVLTVLATYRPFAGDFDGDGYDELFWYAPGAAADSIWNWPADDFLRPVSSPISVGGTYTPVVGDFDGNGADDILWYAPGTAPDTLWYFNPGGTYASVAQPVGGTYRPVAVSIGKDGTDDIAWYAPGTATDSVWDFTLGTRSHTNLPLTVNGTAYRPIGLDAFGQGPRSDDLWWYAPGGGADPFWNYVNGARQPQILLPLGGNWSVAVGDFLGDGREDVYLTDPNVGYTLRDFTVVDGVESWVDYNFRYSSASAGSRTGPAASPPGPRSTTIEPTPPHPLG